MALCPAAASEVPAGMAIAEAARAARVLGVQVISEILRAGGGE